MPRLTEAKVRKLFSIRPGKRVRLSRYPTDWNDYPELAHIPRDGIKGRARALIERNLEALTEAHERLYANDVHSVLVVLQAMDAAGKDGVIKHVMSGLNPQGCQVFSFKKPSDEELDHNFLWRYSKGLPERGRIGIFNRSYYEEVLVVRVHPELLDRQKLPEKAKGPDVWKDRYDDINRFERHLSRSGTLIVKFFLHVSKEEQGRRFLDRIDTPEKNWKFSEADIAERRFWDDYQLAFEGMLTETSKKWAPWWVIPADHKWVCRALVSSILKMEMDTLELTAPTVDDRRRAELAEMRKGLAAELGADSKPTRRKRR
ncbi:MAG TPA: polyphosphate kinase 2 family protein [Vicinamibacterales bacterium]|nr:polyphosphate kinase 2 family protein [Vicinamibacterales bacterium]